MRLRVGIPARELARHVPVWLASVESVITLGDFGGIRDVGAIVIGKLPVSFYTGDAMRAERLVAWAEAAALRRHVVVDFSDDLAAAGAMYGKPLLAQYQKRLLAACSASVPSAALRDRLAGDARHALTVIEDPYERRAPGAVRFAPGAPLKLVWYGVFGPPLRETVERELGNVARRVGSRGAELAFVTYASQAGLVSDMAQRLLTVNPAFAVRHVPWSPESSACEVDRADLVLLPQDYESDWGRVKSHNRLVEAIRSGRFAVASPVPSYLELERYAWIGRNLADGVAWALANTEEVKARLTAGQAHIEARFSPAAIAAKWSRALGISAGG